MVLKVNIHNMEATPTITPTLVVAMDNTDIIHMAAMEVQVHILHMVMVLLAMVMVMEILVIIKVPVVDII